MFVKCSLLVHVPHAARCQEMTKSQNDLQLCEHHALLKCKENIFMRLKSPEKSFLSEWKLWQKMKIFQYNGAVVMVLFQNVRLTVAVARKSGLYSNCYHSVQKKKNKTTIEKNIFVNEIKCFKNKTITICCCQFISYMTIGGGFEMDFCIAVHQQ